MIRFVLYAVFPILLSLFLIFVTLRPEAIIRKDKQYMFIKYRAVWLSVAVILLVANSINLYFYIQRM